VVQALCLSDIFANLHKPPSSEPYRLGSLTARQ
jgi:hypothetical protein